MPGHHVAGIRDVDSSQLFGSKEFHLFIIFFNQHLAEFLVLLHVDGTVAMGAGQHAVPRQRFVYLVVDAFVIVGMLSQAKPDGAHHGYEVKFQHAVGGTAVEGRHDDQQLVFPWVGLADVVDDGDMVRPGSLQIVRTLVAGLQQESRRFLVDKGKDAIVHVVHVAGDGPVEALAQGVECPQSGIVALGGNHFAGSCHSSNLPRQFVGPADMSRQHGDDIPAHAVHAHHGRVAVLVLHIWCNGSYADAHGSDEDKGVVIGPLSAHVCALDDGGAEFSLQGVGHLLAGVADGDDGYLLHFRIVMG